MSVILSPNPSLFEQLAAALTEETDTKEVFTFVPGVEAPEADMLHVFFPPESCPAMDTEDKIKSTNDILPSNAVRVNINTIFDHLCISRRTSLLLLDLIAVTTWPEYKPKLLHAAGILPDHAKFFLETVKFKKLTVDDLVELCHSITFDAEILRLIAYGEGLYDMAARLSPV